MMPRWSAHVHQTWIARLASAKHKNNEVYICTHKMARTAFYKKCQVNICRHKKQRGGRLVLLQVEACKIMIAENNLL